MKTRRRISGNAGRSLDKLIAGPYQLLVTDLEMPDMDGYRLTQKVKQDAPDTKTIIMTGRHEVDCLEMMDVRKPTQTDF